jgi:enoyl-CoA hydratase
MSSIRSEISSNILTITIDREEALNALNDGMIQEIGKILALHEGDNTVHGVIITGAGQKAFAAGADIKNFPSFDKLQGKNLSISGHQVFNSIERYPKIVIAAVNGYALGGGLELAMACHIRIATENAVFGMPETKLGLIPGYGGTQRLVQLIGKAKALEYILTAEMLDAATAVRLGLVNHVVISGLLIEKSVEIIKKISRQGPLAVSKAIETVNAAFNESVDGFALESENFGYLMASEEAKEGIAAFLEKRKPQFRS